MTTTFEERLHQALNDFINTQTGRDGEPVVSQTVTGFDTDTITSGYCETCWYERTVIDIYYIDAKTGREKIHVYDGDFGALIRELS